eukprot:TRINITY_DN33696_c0_g2_i2.p2 TRINITY_DN33696_c0_g2~~TRINITY_DN33696_c0_g2_i2.p2  ORF type:complete len:101 (-),score=12.60 TRINITY_DN33696_c0_g2_i2:127-429(-)
MIRRPPRSTLSSSSAASDVYKRQTPCRGYIHSTYLVASNCPAGVFCAEYRWDLLAALALLGLCWVCCLPRFLLGEKVQCSRSSLSSVDSTLLVTRMGDMK